jgi:hypothetical protein
MKRKVSAPHVIIEPRKPDLRIEIRYHRKTNDDNESVVLIWKTNKSQPTMRALTSLERNKLLDLLLKLSRSAFK